MAHESQRSPCRFSEGLTTTIFSDSVDPFPHIGVVIEPILEQHVRQQPPLVVCLEQASLDRPAVTMPLRLDIAGPAEVLHPRQL